MSQVLVFVGIVTAFALVAVLVKPAVSGRPRYHPPRGGSRRVRGGRGNRTSYDGDIPTGGDPAYGGGASDGDGPAYGDGAASGDGD
ncbi:hypothetical protein [Streptomyces sp. WMMB303]|uniref:hypothetical protein n=1 Tax=Streptomyces sp. WMMB303 TaxID=3034154 RepID=UPI0023EA9AFC|nr:hypothetical protein [Streptomyces sp. WMMB303]MDF4254498.1 hypothetical protein [Streptomyces sp. WMMB303]